MEPATSKGARTWSKGIEAFNRSNKGAWSAAKRPPHGLPEPAAEAGPGAGTPLSVPPAAPGPALLVRVGEHLEQALMPTRIDLHREAPKLDEAHSGLVAERVP